MANTIAVCDSPSRASQSVTTRAWWTAIIYIAAAAMLLRFYDLALKPLHHDEGVNALLLTKLVRPPHIYQYDPANYHGPTLYYLAWLSTIPFGLTTVAIRLVPALAGFALVLLILSLRRWIGWAGAISAAVLVALSPGAVYYSRYFIHETLLVCATLATVTSVAMWWSGRRTLYVHLAAISAGLMFATKETAIISAAVLTIAAGGARILTRRDTFGDALGDSGRRRQPISDRWRAAAWLAAQAVASFLVVSVLFYTSFLARWDGAIDALTTFAVWTRTGTAVHVHPWFAYLAWLSEAEVPLLALGAGGSVLALWKREQPFAVFAALWAGGIIAAYSMIPYKTPWLTLNMIVPLAIAAGYGCESIWRNRESFGRRLPVSGALVIVSIMTVHTVTLSFWRYDDEGHSYVYAHTSRDVLALVEEIGRIEAQNPGSAIAVTSRDHFPLSWYLRDYRVAYHGRPVATEAPIVIASAEQKEMLDASLGEGYRRLGEYRLRPGVRLVLYARTDLRPTTTAQRDR